MGFRFSVGEGASSALLSSGLREGAFLRRGDFLDGGLVNGQVGRVRLRLEFVLALGRAGRCLDMLAEVELAAGVVKRPGGSWSTTLFGVAAHARRAL